VPNLPSMTMTSRPKLPTWALALIVPVIAVIVTLNVTSDDSGSASTGSAVQGGNAIVIKNFAFSPTPLRVKAGATVTVTNNDSAAHTLTADKGAFDTGVLDGGKQMTITIDKAGTYAYHCDIHNYMTGEVVAS
jgi:plastocyanin